MGLNRRNKPLKLLKFENSTLHPNSYYNLTALLQSGLLQGRVIYHFQRGRLCRPDPSHREEATNADIKERKGKGKNPGQALGVPAGRMFHGRKPLRTASW